MEYLYPVLLPQLQTLCTVAEYQQLMTPHISQYGLVTLPPCDNDRYWEIIPRYTYAECPICGQRYQEPIDTYSLKTWSGFFNRDILKLTFTFLKKWDLQKRKHLFPTHCPHFKGIATFIHLHNQPLYDCSQFHSDVGEVP